MKSINIVIKKDAPEFSVEQIKPEADLAASRNNNNRPVPPAIPPRSPMPPRPPGQRPAPRNYGGTRPAFGHRNAGQPGQAGHRRPTPGYKYPQRTDGRPTDAERRDFDDRPSQQDATAPANEAPARRGRGRARMGARRPKVPTHRHLPPTDIHRGKFGPPKTESDQASVEQDNTLKVIALGGLGEIGKNMYMLEYKDDIVIIDAGIMFPEDNMPGIDFLIPNTEYIYSKRQNIRGLILTHGHMDHIGAVPYLQDKLGNPDIYTAALTRGIVLKRHAEFPHLPKLPIHIVKSGDKVKMGDYMEVEFFHMNHNIPDDLGVVVRTPVGNVIHTADFKFDPNPVNDVPVDFDMLQRFGDEGVLALMCDSTDAEREGHSISEQTIFENLELIFKEATGMLITGTFSSMVNRIQQIVQLSEKYGRKVVFDGYSLKSNIEIAKELGYVKIAKGTQISAEQVDDYPRENITIVSTGAQGEENASLMRIVNREHRHVGIQPKDSVILSSSVVPGNERTVQRLKDMLYRAGVKVYHYQMMDIHAGGHARQEDLRKIIELLRPKFLMPIHGQYSMMVTLGSLGKEKGMSEDNIIIADNGQIIHFTPEAWWFDKKTAPSNYVMVDGLGIGDVGNVVLRDRQVLAEDGMFVIVILADARNGQLRGSPDIISRGFIYLKENKDLLTQVRKRIRHIIESEKARPLNLPYLKDQIRDEVGKFLFQKTERRPMILPVIIEV